MATERIPMRTAQTLFAAQRVPARTPLQLAWRQLLKHRVALIGGVILIILYGMALFADVPPPASAAAAPPKNLSWVPPGRFPLRGGAEPPRLFLMGTDSFGRDLFSRIL